MEPDDSTNNLTLYDGSGVTMNDIFKEYDVKSLYEALRSIDPSIASKMKSFTDTLDEVSTQCGSAIVTSVPGEVSQSLESYIDNFKESTYHQIDIDITYLDAVLWAISYKKSPQPGETISLLTKLLGFITKPRNSITINTKETRIHIKKTRIHIKLINYVINSIKKQPKPLSVEAMLYFNKLYKIYKTE